MTTKFKALSALVAFAMVFGLACGKSGISPASRPDGQVTTCLFDGKGYNPGDTFRMDCNTCSCGTSGQVACTLMACLDDAGLAPDAAFADLPRDAWTTTDQALHFNDAQFRDSFFTTDVAANPDSLPTTDVADAAVDAGQGCVWQGTALAVGQSIDAGDGCNICMCMAAGMVACTARACASTPDAPTLACTLSSPLGFGYVGGLVAYHDNYSLIDGLHITVIRINSNGKDAGMPSCTSSLPTCGTAGVVSISTIAQDLADPEVQLALGATTSDVYGVDSRASDGSVWSIYQQGGGTILVGTPCPSPVMSSCRPIPPGVQRLADDLKTLGTAATAAPECARL